jgi:hypothetical protein
MGTSQITGKYSTDYGNTWNWISGITTDPVSKLHLTSVYYVSNNSWVGWQWRLNDTGPSVYNIEFERLPEFSDVMMPMAIIVLLTFYLGRRRKKKGLEREEEST